ncbi:MAG: NAD(P)H-hydrate dehydratase [Candidatus Thorarchaeota archaeon]|nr:NAD(P)H-hydrate dehydratase [Candidatus Thorarchaeota archaeon]
MGPTPMTTSEMRVLELNAEYLGVTLGTLMENAGREVARVLDDNESVEEKRILILCGVGGNGGDGMVAARHLQEAGAFVKVILIGDAKRISSEDTLRNWKILENLNAIPHEIFGTETAIKKCKSIDEADILIDALLGFGLTSNVREPTATAIRSINKASGKRVSIDIPSGMCSDSGKVLGVAVKADQTITMHAPKVGMLRNPEQTGSLHVVPIGIPPEADHVCGPGDLWLFNQPRKKDSHKGDFGRILVVGGSDVYSGAPALAGIAALTTGADLVTILAPEPVVPTIRSYSPNLMVQSLGTDIFNSESIEVVLDLALQNDVIALGPGLGVASDTLKAFKEIAESLASLNKPLVIDADGLKALSNTGQVFDPSNTILTPHLGELNILLKRKSIGKPDEDTRLEMSQEAANMYGAVVLLKGSVDIVADPDGRFKMNRTGDPAMTVGGTGDVLTGITSALLAQGQGAFNSAACAAYVSGLAGELAARDLGGRILATDCIESIPLVMQK